MYSILNSAYLSWDSSLHVVSSTPGVEKLVVALDKSSEEEHLDLTPSGDGIPGIQTLGGQTGEINTEGQFSWNTGSGSNGPPSNKGSHGNTSVLYLSTILDSIFFPLIEII